MRKAPFQINGKRIFNLTSGGGEIANQLKKVNLEQNKHKSSKIMKKISLTPIEQTKSR